MSKEDKIISIVVLLLLVFITVGAITFKRKVCITAYKDYNPQWGLMSGCRIVVDGKLTPVDIVRELK